MIDKICAIITNDTPWQYYNKFKIVLKELKHPFEKKIDFLYQSNLDTEISFLKNYRAVAFFHRDPLKILYQREYLSAKYIEEYCIINNIPFINKPDALSNSVKSIQLKILKNKGFNVAECFPFISLDELTSIDKSIYPLFVRYDAGHDSYGESMQGPFGNFIALKRAFSNKWFVDREHFCGKVAIQWIDTKFSDGLYRRYRAFSTRTDAVTGNLHISRDWYLHGDNAIRNQETENEQRQFMQGIYSATEKEFFSKAIMALDLDFGAIDYSYDKNGEIIIWEVNPHPAFPQWIEQEPSKSKIVKLLTEYYQSFL